MTNSNYLPYPENEPDLNVVYYMRNGKNIKIGTTSNLPNRMKVIKHQELLAIEPGSFGTEHMRHLEFAPHCVEGEWFADCPPIRDHIANVLKTYGHPKMAWVRWVVAKEVKENTLI